MAIDPDIPGLEVEILVDKQAVKEFEEPVVEDNGDGAFEELSVSSADDVILTTPKAKKVTKYIEATPGANFAIRLRIKPGFEYIANDLMFYINVDGTVSRARILFKEDHAMGRDLHIGDVTFLRNE